MYGSLRQQQRLGLYIHPIHAPFSFTLFLSPFSITLFITLVITLVITLAITLVKLKKFLSFPSIKWGNCREAWGISIGSSLPPSESLRWIEAWEAVGHGLGSRRPWLGKPSTMA
jgi:hypothetical protein